MLNILKIRNFKYKITKLKKEKNENVQFKKKIDHCKVDVFYRIGCRWTKFILQFIFI